MMAHKPGHKKKSGMKKGGQRGQKHLFLISLSFF